MKKWGTIVIDVLLVVASLVSMGYLLMDTIFANKWISYAVWGITYLFFFYQFASKVQTKSSKAALSLMTATLLTGQLMFFQPFVYFLEYNGSAVTTLYGWRLFAFLAGENWTYHESALQGFRYPAIFVGTLILCMLIAWICTAAAKKSKTLSEEN